MPNPYDRARAHGHAAEPTDATFYTASSGAHSREGSADAYGPEHDPEYDAAPPPSYSSHEH